MVFSGATLKVNVAHSIRRTHQINQCDVNVEGREGRGFGPQLLKMDGVKPIVVNQLVALPTINGIPRESFSS